MQNYLRQPKSFTKTKTIDETITSDIDEISRQGSNSKDKVNKSKTSSYVKPPSPLPDYFGEALKDERLIANPHPI